MNVLEFTLLIGCSSVAAGFLGSLTGLGGGMVIVPLLTLVFHVDIHYAVGASLVSVIATSSGAAAGYVRDGYTNVRIGMLLEIATTLGALVGASVASLLPGSLISVLFGVALLSSAVAARREPDAGPSTTPPDLWAMKLRLNGTLPTPDGPKAYRVRWIPLGFALSTVAGLAAGLLGIGAGALKVLVMDQVMRMPFKVSTATSNFMIGVTAAAGVGVYLDQGFIDPGLAMPVMLGVTLGSWLGGRVLAGADTRWLRLVFSAVVLLIGVEMIRDGLTGRW